jgi:hypothetical protein
VTFDFSAEKIRADSVGSETPIAINDWIDVGVYALSNGAEKLVYLEKHKVTEKRNSLVIRVKEKPSRVGIDPLHKLIDRHPNDNVGVVKGGG